MGILNIQKVPSWIILNIHEAKSWVFWIFMKWRHRHFECSKADVKWMFKSWRRCKYSWNNMGILNFQKLTHGHFEYLWGDVIGILNTKWRYGIIQKLTPWVFWIFIVTFVFLIFIQNYVVLWIFMIMTSLQEYSKYQCHWIFKIPMASALNIPMTAIREYSKYPWHEYSQYPWC